MGTVIAAVRVAADTEEPMCRSMFKRQAAIAVLALTLTAAGSASAGADVSQRNETTGVSPPALDCGAVDTGALTLQSDFAAFMRHDCPDAVRIEALRQLWRLLPPVVLAENAAF
jgi:Protein of unknown function (DUF3306)